jgi:hypothetical protein
MLYEREKYCKLLVEPLNGTLQKCSKIIANVWRCFEQISEISRESGIGGHADFN